MKNKGLVFSILIIAALALAACGSTAATSGSSEPRTVSVNGTGTVILAPDMAIINVGVVSEAEDSVAASEANAELVEEIKAALINLGVAESDLKTTNFSVYPMQQHDDQGQITSILYRVENNMQVKVRDLDNLGTILDGAIGAGANSIYGVQFDLSDREAANAQAIEAAMENAQGRAGVLAQAAGAELGEIQSVSTYLYGGGVPARFAEAAAEEGIGMGGSVPITPGEMEIQVEVTVVYAIN